MAVAQKSYEYCTVHTVCSGDELYSDLRVENRVWMRSGHILTEHEIEFLKKRHIGTICVKRRKFNDIDESLKSVTDLFFQAVGYNSLEMRYGRTLKDSTDIQFIKELFLSYMKNAQWREHFLMLKDFDGYLYRHATDVFTLATLFAKHENMPNISQFAIGYLLYDIGTVYTSLLLLQKKDPFTNAEQRVVQQHVERGEIMLESLGLERVSHFSKQHHERIDGSGYPYALTEEDLSVEVQLLQIVDTYSALTMKRAHQPAMSASEAFEHMYRLGTQFNKQLLNRFIEFIGIYPQGSIVALTTGEEAVVEANNELMQLLPRVRTAHKSMILPMDLSVTIKRLVSYEVDTAKELFTHLSNYLIKGDTQHVQRYYEQLKLCYARKDWSTQIFIPIYHLLQMLKRTNYLQTAHLQHALSKLQLLLDDTLQQFRNENVDEPVLLVTTNTPENPTLIKIFKSLLYTQGFSAYAKSKESYEQVLEQMHMEYIITIGDHPYQFSTKQQNFHLTEPQLNSLLAHFSGKYMTGKELETYLKKYKRPF